MQMGMGLTQKTVRTGGSIQVSRLVKDQGGSRSRSIVWRSSKTMDDAIRPVDRKILLWKQSHVCEMAKRRSSGSSATQDPTAQDH
jgi:hypothetical protein